jgi:hypothetical protein
MLSLKVPNIEVKYDVLVGDKVPSFTFVPSSFEVI